jgi:hypothetical protein
MLKTVKSLALFLMILSPASVFAKDVSSDFKFELSQDVQSWISEPPISFVTEKVLDTARGELGLGDSAIENIFVERVFVSGFYNVYIQNNRYVVDPYANYWVQNNESDFFMFDKGAYNITASNGVKESLMEMIPFIESIAPDYLVEYKPINTSEKKTVYAFMDLSCPHCKSFHLSTRSDWQSQGVRVVYIPFLKDQSNKRVAEATAGAFCQQNKGSRAKAVNDVYMKGYRGLGLNSQGCTTIQKTIFDFLFNSGARYGLEGSPMFLTDTGRIYYGTTPFEMGELESLEAL